MSVGIPPSTSLFLPSPAYGSRLRRAPPTPAGPVLPKLPLPIDGLARLGSGLRTPPVEDMSTAFQPTLANYGGHGMHDYVPVVPQAARQKPAIDDSRNTAYYRYPSQQQAQQQEQQQQQQAQQQHQAQQQRHNILQHHAQQQQQQQHQQQQQQQRTHQHQHHQLSLQVPYPSEPSVNSSLSSVTQATSASRLPTGPSTPASGSIASVQNEGSTSRRGSETLIYHSLQIPKCIAPTGGNLADFAAQMTCLFWFESIEGLQQAQQIRSKRNAQVSRLPALAKPYDQFRKWVLNVLSTTQVTQNVILLALLFIYRLKMSTPQIKGRGGSEYRLLTVALMLGNKFLDDNTYTNKTWAEVSCFAVHEIHVMEVEFLSNMRYNLLATKDQWDEWLDKLACFHEYYDRAARIPASPIHVPSPTGHAYSPVPSPTASMHPTSNLPVTPTITTNFSPISSHSQNWTAYQANTVSPLAAKPTIAFPIGRKRSPEGDADYHPAKRPAPHRVPPVAPGAVLPLRPAGSQVESSRLPVPHLTLVTEQPPPAQPHTSVNGYSQGQTSQPMVQPHQAHVSLPPLHTGVRAMATVYQAPVTMTHQQSVLPATTGVGLTTNYASHGPASLATSNKHYSPGSLGQYKSSPMVEHFSQASAVPTPLAHTPISHSPSIYLQQRPSPYKPVRHVNTLLYPPPSASLDQYHLSVPVAPAQMHYQPLGRRNDLRTGIVPEFLVFNRGQYQNVPGQNLGPYAN